MLKITHLAHACFLVENDLDKLIIDPADNSFGYEFNNEIVNYLLTSHDHWDHNNTKNIKLEKSNNSIDIIKINSFHDNQNGELRGNNIIHIIDTENTRICHLGDLGHILNDEQIKMIGHVEILLIPVGGVFTIDIKEALEVINQLNPDTIIPMHYQTDYWGKDKGIASVDKFIQVLMGYQIVRPGNQSLDYKKPTEKTAYII